MSYIGAQSAKQYIGAVSGTGGTAPAPIVQRGPFATWGDLPATGLRNGEVIPITDLSGTAPGVTGAGSALWNGTSWTPVPDTPAAATAAGKQARLTVTVRIAASTTISTAGAGASWTHTGDTDANLGASAAAFANPAIGVLLNGRSVKGDAVWVSASSLRLPMVLDPNDVLAITTP